jgi:hypothetical protein
MLARLFNALQASGASVSVVFVSADRSEPEFRSYLQSMPPAWWAVPFAGEGERRRADLSQRFNVTGVPTLLLFDTSTDPATLMTPHARTAVIMDQKVCGSSAPAPPARSRANAETWRSRMASLGNAQGIRFPWSGFHEPHFSLDDLKVRSPRAASSHPRC